MPVLKISPPSQPERVIRKEKDLLFVSLRLVNTCVKERRNLALHVFSGSMRNAHIFLKRIGKKTEAVSQIETGSNQEHRQNQVVRCACEMGRLAIACSEHLLRLLLIEL